MTCDEVLNLLREYQKENLQIELIVRLYVPSYLAIFHFNSGTHVIEAFSLKELIEKIKDFMKT